MCGCCKITDEVILHTPGYNNTKQKFQKIKDGKKKKHLKTWKFFENRFKNTQKK